MNTMTDRELMEWLETVPTTEETLAKLKQMDIPNLDNEPKFVADLLKGMVTEDLLHAMDEQGLNRNQLAKKMGKSRQYIGRVLNENANFTLERLAEFACALDRKIEIRICHKDEAAWVRPGKGAVADAKHSVDTALHVPFPSREAAKSPRKFALWSGFKKEENRTDLANLEAERGEEKQYHAA